MFVYLVHNFITHNNQKVEAKQMYNGKWKKYTKYFKHT